MFISVHIAYVCILKSEYPHNVSLVLHSAFHQFSETCKLDFMGSQFHTYTMVVAIL